MPFWVFYAGLEVQVQADTGYVYCIFYFCNDWYLYRLYETQKFCANLIWSWFSSFTRMTHEYGMHVILQDVVIVYQYTQPLFESHLVRKYLYNIIYQYTVLKGDWVKVIFFPDDSMYHHNSLIIIIVQGIILL